MKARLHHALVDRRAELGGVPDHLIDQSLVADHAAVEVAWIHAVGHREILREQALDQRMDLADDRLSERLHVRTRDGLRGNQPRLGEPRVEVLENRERLFLATKVTAPGGDLGASKVSVEQSFDRLRTDRIDLMQVHNLNGVDALATMLQELKEATVGSTEAGVLFSDSSVDCYQYRL